MLFEPLFPDRIHYCDQPRGHDDTLAHQQDHAVAGACGGPNCKARLWRERDPARDPISLAIDSICETLDDLHAFFVALNAPARPIDEPRQLQLFSADP